MSRESAKYALSESMRLGGAYELLLDPSPAAGFPFGGRRISLAPSAGGSARDPLRSRPAAIAVPSHVDRGHGRGQVR